MSGTAAVLGALGGTIIFLAAGVIGARSVLAAAVNEEQRKLLRQMLAVGSGYAAAVMGLVLLAAFGVLPGWTYAAAMVLWFGPLLPGLAWAHQRLDLAAAGTNPSIA